MIKNFITNMGKPRTKVVKSKSSNSAITTKSEHRTTNNKKTRSNAEFQPLILKKRGVYVEKKNTKVSINERDHSPLGIPRKPSSPRPVARPIPRPGRKRFLTSVLTILSQSTTGTQYPEQDETDRLKGADRTKAKLKKKRDEEIIQEDSIAPPYSSKKKLKYRSKVLNANDSDFEQLVVLQSTKEITHTPSNYSEKSNYRDASNVFKERETVKWADILPPLANLESVIAPQETAKEVPEQNKDKMVEKDPSTLVAEGPKKEEKKLYNFFVDLLETTFSVYNVKTEPYPPLPSSVNSSKVALEINESVAKKLNISKIKEPAYDDVTRENSSKYFYCIRPDENETWNDKQLLEHFQPKAKSASPKRSRAPFPTKSFERRRRLQPEPYDYRKATPIPLSANLNIPNKRITLKKDRKKDFINLLKDQLKMEDDAFEEPQNFFQALKVIARNKRRCRKSIHIKESKKLSDGDVHVCQFRRRKLLSARTKSSGKKSSYYPENDVVRSMRSFSRYSDFTSTPKKRTTITITETSENETYPSQHSLEVFGFDYEPAPKKLPQSKKKMAVPFHSTASNGLYARL